MSRDPLKDPKFGDVFRFSEGTTTVMFLRRHREDPTDWWGMIVASRNHRMSTGSCETNWQPLTNPAWTVIEAAL